MKYILTLKNGEKRDVLILGRPVFQMYFHGDASPHFNTKKEIEESKQKVQSVDYTMPFRLYAPGAGYCTDEGAMFDVYKGVRNPIVKLELVSSDN